MVAAPCESFSKTTWTLNTAKGSLRLVGSAAKPLSICSSPLKDTGVENSRLEIVDAKGSVIYKKGLVVNFVHYFDTGKDEGGALPSADVSFAVLIPHALGRRETLKVRLIRTSDGTELGQGRF